MSSLKNRLLQPELMDDPQLAAGEHVTALQHLSRLNRVGAFNRILAAIPKSDRPLRILDIATGSGDLPRAIHHRFGDRVEVHGVDFSEKAVALARSLSPDAITYHRRDVLKESLHDLGTFDVITISQFLHHLSAQEIVWLLKKLEPQCSKRMIIGDLRRCMIAWWGTYLFTRLITRSRVVHTDGLLSIQAGFTTKELRRMTKACGFHGAETRTHMVIRLFMVWDREGNVA